MGYKVNVHRNKAWENFILGRIDTPKYTPNWLNNDLSEFNCKNLEGTPYVEFDTEADALLFTLRWA